MSTQKPCPCSSSRSREPEASKDIYRFGEELGQFLRGVLAAPIPPVATPGKKWLLFDAMETSGGTFISLDASFDVGTPIGGFGQDLLFGGVAQFPNGDSFPIDILIGKDYANVLALVPIPGKPNTYHVAAAGIPQPARNPYEVYVHERDVSGTGVVRITGQIYDPQGSRRLSFTITHDIAPIIVVAIVVGLALLICGAITIAERDDCVSKAQSTCGDRGVKKVHMRRTFALSWSGAEGADVGCGKTCDIDCN